MRSRARSTGISDNEVLTLSRHARDKREHDVETLSLPVMPGHSRPKDGVLSHAYVPGIHVLTTLQRAKTWMAGTSPAMTN
jgi:hypothetical protein